MSPCKDWIMIETMKITLDVLVAFSVWCAAVMFAVFIAILARHVVIDGGMTAYHLLHS